MYRIYCSPYAEPSECPRDVGLYLYQPFGTVLNISYQLEIIRPVWQSKKQRNLTSLISPEFEPIILLGRFVNTWKLTLLLEQNSTCDTLFNWDPRFKSKLAPGSRYGWHIPLWRFSRHPFPHDLHLGRRVELLRDVSRHLFDGHLFIRSDVVWAQGLPAQEDRPQPDGQIGGI